jgi:hypothetical protein
MKSKITFFFHKTPAAQTNFLLKRGIRTFYNGSSKDTMYFYVDKERADRLVVEMNEGFPFAVFAEDVEN